MTDTPLRQLIARAMIICGLCAAGFMVLGVGSIAVGAATKNQWWWNVTYPLVALELCAVLAVIILAGVYTLRDERG